MPLEVRPDARVLSFAGLDSLIACLLFGLAPAILASRQSFRPALSEIRADRWRLGKGLIVAQMAISTLLLIGAGLFGRTLLNMYFLDAGFASHNVLLFRVSTDKAGIRGDKLHQVEARLLSELKTLPGLRSASLSVSADPAIEWSSFACAGLIVR